MWASNASMVGLVAFTRLGKVRQARQVRFSEAVRN